MITEERFQKLTLAQWMFHYSEIQKKEKDENDKLSLIMQQLELVGTMANPAAGKKLKEFREMQKAQEEIPAESFEDEFIKLKDMIPSELQVTFNDAPEKFVLPKYESSESPKKKKKLGITKGGEGIDTK